jgi:hypothetical protein
VVEINIDHTQIESSNVEKDKHLPDKNKDYTSNDFFDYPWKN